MQTEFLPMLAGFVSEWFPSFRGRVVAVTEAELTKENRPELPCAMLALNREEAEHSARGYSEVKISDDFIIEMWLPLKKYMDAKSGAESPFWAYYPYEALRNRLLTRMLDESRERPSWGIRYISMDVASDAGAVILTFRFSRNYTWCPDENELSKGDPLEITFSACPTLAPSNFEAG